VVYAAHVKPNDDSRSPVRRNRAEYNLAAISFLYSVQVSATVERIVSRSCGGVRLTAADR